MTSIRDKNLLFYSIHPNDEYSRDFLKELDKYSQLKKQFILICVNDPNIKIPDKIKQLNKVPVLVAAGFGRPILGNDAVSWLKNGGLQDKANGFDYGTLDDDLSKYACLTDDLKPSDYNQFYNSDYNHGFTDKDSIINQQFSKLNDNAHITTFDDANELKKDISGQLEQRLSQLRQQRDADVPRPMKRIGGLEDQQMGGGGGGGQMGGQNFMGNNFQGNNNNNTGSLAYNPNPFSSHQVPSNGPQLPFNMPTMNQSNGSSLGQGYNNGPALPFNMPGLNMGMQMPQVAMQLPQMGIQVPQIPQMGMQMPPIATNQGQMPQLPFTMSTMPARQNTQFRNPNL